MRNKLIALALLACSAALLWYVFIGRPVGLSQQLEWESVEPYAARDWGQERVGSINISVYVFRDRNRTGVYDLGDLPMAAVVVELIDANGETRETGSNINGYANFKMQYGSPEQPISKVDVPYRFRVLPPPGWRITSGNQEQTIVFRGLPGSVAGLVAEQAPEWVGLAPNLRIGLALPEEPDDRRVVRVTDPFGESSELTPGPDGRLEIDAVPGPWRVAVSRQGGEAWFESLVEVKDSPVELAVPAADQASRAPLPSPVSEGFDWLQRSGIDKIPNGHAGLNWDYLIAVHNQQYAGPGYVNGLTSGQAVAYNSSGHPVTISAPAGERFDFVGGYFSVAWSSAHGETLDVEAWRDGQRVARRELKLSYLGPVWLQADFRQIDRLSLATRHYWQFVADDLEFRLANPVAE